MLSAQTEMDMVECPYNKAHRMLRKRLQPHLLKCRLNYPDMELRKCPFNQTHLVPEPEFVHHVTSCPDRRLITQYKYDAVETKEEERVKHEPIECDENWDDTEVEDYDPKKYIATANVLRRPEGHQPSQRKSFIKQERKRLGDFNSDDEAEERNEEAAKALASQPKSPRIKKEEPVSDDEADNDYGRRRMPSPASPRSSWGRRRMPSPASPRSSWGDKHMPPRRAYRSRRSPSRSPSPLLPPPRVGARREYYHSRSPPRREPELYARRSPLARQRSPPQRLAPPPAAPRNRSPHKRPAQVEEPYDLDDDPYYNGGASVSASTSNSNTRPSSSRSSTSDASLRYAPYNFNQYRTDTDRLDLTNFYELNDYMEGRGDVPYPPYRG